MENIIRFDKNNVVEYPMTFQAKDLICKLSKSPHEWVKTPIHRFEVFYGDKQLWKQDLPIKYCEDLKMEYLETTLFGIRKCLIFADGIIKYPY
jgi:hypothetical protein